MAESDSVGADTDGSQSYGSESDNGVFFADATLDLNDAHDIADEAHNSSLSMDIDDYGNRELNLTEQFHMEDPYGNANVDNDATNIEMRALAGLNSSNGDSRQYGRISNTEMMNKTTPSSESLAPKFRPKKPRHLKDRSFTLAFILFIPLSFSASKIFSKSFNSFSNTNNISGWAHAASSPQASPYTHIPLILVSTIALIAARFMYKIPGGGEGENARHVLSNLFNQSSILAVLSHIMLLFQIYFLCPNARIYTIFPLTWFLTDILVKRELCLTGSPRLSVASTGVGSSYSEMAGRRGIWGSLLPGRMVFFQAMVDVSLDILSRSLRRAVFMRVIMTVLLVQNILLFVWVGGFWKLLSLDLHSSMKSIIVLLVVTGAWWMCSFLSRVLGLIASGGITSWFANQKVILQKEEEEKNKLEAQGDKSTNEAEDRYEHDSAGFTYGMQDAYRTVDASAYSCVRDYDEGIEDDYPTEEEFDHVVNDNNPNLASNETDWNTNTTVNAFLLSALTISAGSVIKCALLGPLAEWLQFSLRHIDGQMQSTFDGQRHHPMNISPSINGSKLSLRGALQKLKTIFRALHFKAHTFVKSHSEYGMCHIAAYYKSYHRASSDVSSLIFISGVEPILHDDITSIMCSTIATAVTGWMSIFLFFSLAHHRGGKDPSSSFHLTDSNVCQILIVQYSICYIMMSTLLEPLRASIQAVYVAFAQCPESMSHAFPLVFHRLRRISEGTATNRIFDEP